MDELEILSRATCIISPSPCCGWSSTGWTSSRIRGLANVLALLLDLFLDPLNLSLLLLDHALVGADLVLEISGARSSVRVVVDCTLPVQFFACRTLALHIDFSCGSLFKLLLRSCDSCGFWRLMHDGLKDFGLNGLLSLNGSVRIGLGLCLHVNWQLEGVELRLL